MAEIAEIVDVNITTEPSAVTQEGFGIGLILGKHLHSTPRYQVFNTLAALAAVHGTTSPIYLAAAKYFGQSPAPARVAVGRRQVNTCNVTITVVDEFTYSVTINGVAYTYESGVGATEQQIVDGLIAAIAASAVVGSDGGANTLTITADVAGTAFSLALGANLALASTTAAGTLADDLTAIQLENRNWYGVILADARASADFQAAIDWVATTRKLLAAPSQEANARDVSDASDSTTLPAILKDEAQDRAIPVWHEDITTFPDAAVIGRVLPKAPGSYTAKFKALTGIAVSSLTETQAQNLLDKNCNIYEEIGGRAMLRNGTVASGKFIDQIHGRDWLQARLEEAVFEVLSTPDKVPFTDAGVVMIENAVNGVLQEGVDVGYLASFVPAKGPLVSAVSAQNKADRLLPDVNFSAVEAGAIHGATINGTISV